jgi:hypothetical protein
LHAEWFFCWGRYIICASTRGGELAVPEAARVLRPDGLVSAVGINRLGYLRDAFRLSPREGATLRNFHKHFLSNGNLDPEHAPPLGFAHLRTSAELRELTFIAFEAVILGCPASFA